MDIKRAKKEIKDSIEAYLAKDEFGDYMIPQIRQRPILLMGPPGIGKPRSWSRWPKSVKWRWWHIRLRTTPDRVRWDCHLLKRKYIAEKNIPLPNIR